MDKPRFKQRFPDYRVATFTSRDWQIIVNALTTASLTAESVGERKDYEILATDIQNFIIKQPSHENPLPN